MGAASCGARLYQRHCVRRRGRDSPQIHISSSVKEIMTHSVKKEKLIVFMIGRKKSNRLTNSQTLFVRKYGGRCRQYTRGYADRSHARSTCWSGDVETECATK